jgi:hypothetical protein
MVVVVMVVVGRRKIVGERSLVSKVLLAFPQEPPTAACGQLTRKFPGIQHAPERGQLRHL